MNKYLAIGVFVCALGTRTHGMVRSSTGVAARVLEDGLHELSRRVSTLLARIADLECAQRAEIARRSQKPGVPEDPVYAAFRKACKRP